MTDPAQEDFCLRFQRYMVSAAGPTFADGASVAEYAAETAPTYYEDDSMREAGPEEAASTDISYWEVDSYDD